MGYNVQDMLRKIVIHHTKNIKKLKINFCYDLKLVSFKKMKH